MVLSFRTTLSLVGIPYDATLPEMAPQATGWLGLSYWKNLLGIVGVLKEAERYRIRIHRISQGSGIMLLTDEEIRGMARLAASTYNVPTGLSLAQIAAVRQAVSIPLDGYVGVPDDFGGFLRHYEMPALVRVAAPVYLKFGLRNAPNIYPSGAHQQATAVALTRERVRRAAPGIYCHGRRRPRAAQSELGAAGLALAA